MSRLTDLTLATGLPSRPNMGIAESEERRLASLGGPVAVAVSRPV